MATFQKFDNVDIAINHIKNQGMDYNYKFIIDEKGTLYMVSYSDKEVYIHEFVLVYFFPEIKDISYSDGENQFYGRLAKEKKLICGSAFRNLLIIRYLSTNITSEQVKACKILYDLYKDKLDDDSGANDFVTGYPVFKRWPDFFVLMIEKGLYGEKKGIFGNKTEQKPRDNTLLQGGAGLF
ncbi:MAG: hypothetical protein CVU81_02185 [Euryarchaeota archaeon HGW-Euryarchaeota-1]|nr:MAG: hypothetical protein CVU81_02185 [Euryarchaeota archaeon HGW-Euryarchaeota-1]